MPKISDKELAVARVYSSAMLGLAQASGQADALLDELGELVALLEKNPELDGFLSSPMIDPEARKRSIEKLFRGKVSDLMVDSLQILNRKGRLDLIRAVAQTYRLNHAETHGLIDAHVRTAVPLTDDLRGRIKEVVRGRTGKTGRLIEEIDDSLLGGLVVQVGDEKLDASLATRLGMLRRSLSARGSREVHGGRAYVEAGD